jgi:hypothetical protein
MFPEFAFLNSSLQLQVTPGIGDTPLLPKVLKRKTDHFIDDTCGDHIFKYAPYGTKPDAAQEAGWQRARKHARDLMLDYIRTHNPKSKLELEQLLRTHKVHRYDGVKLGDWIERKERGEWAVTKGEPLLLSHLRKHTENGIKQFAVDHQVSGFEDGIHPPMAKLWSLYDSLENIERVIQEMVDEDNEKEHCEITVVNVTVWEQFKCWAVNKTRKQAFFDSRMLPAVLIAAFVAPDELTAKFSKKTRKKRCEEFDLDKVRAQTVQCLVGIAKAGDVLKKKNFTQLVAWFEDWALKEGRYVFRLIFDCDPEVEKWRKQQGFTAQIESWNPPEGFEIEQVKVIGKKRSSEEVEDLETGRADNAVKMEPYEEASGTATKRSTRNR